VAGVGVGDAPAPVASPGQRVRLGPNSGEDRQNAGNKQWLKLQWILGEMFEGSGGRRSGVRGQGMAPFIGARGL
jgi:hypothetical protein